MPKLTYLVLGAALVLSACGDKGSVQVDSPSGYDTIEMTSGGKGVTGPVSSKLHPKVDAGAIPVIDKTQYSFDAAAPIGLVKYETSKQSKAKIKKYLQDQSGGEGFFTFDNVGSMGVITYTAQQLKVPTGIMSDYEIQAVFVRNEDNISMLVDYGMRWHCQNEDLIYWKTEPCS